MVNMLLRGARGARPNSWRASDWTCTEPIKVRFIRMSAELSESLDYPSKLSRHPDHIGRLIADGEAQAGSFLAEFDEASQTAESGTNGAGRADRGAGADGAD